MKWQDRWAKRCFERSSLYPEKINQADKALSIVAFILYSAFASVTVGVYVYALDFIFRHVH